MLQIEAAASARFLDLKPLQPVTQLIHEGLEEYTLAFLNHGDLGVVDTTSLHEH